MSLTRFLFFFLILTPALPSPIISFSVMFYVYSPLCFLLTFIFLFLFTPPKFSQSRSCLLSLCLFYFIFFFSQCSASFFVIRPFSHLLFCLLLYRLTYFFTFTVLSFIRFRIYFRSEPHIPPSLPIFHLLVYLEFSPFRNYYLGDDYLPKVPRVSLHS